MNVFSGVLVYVLIWTVVLFTVLPWRGRTGKAQEEERATGTVVSAPDKPALGRKFLATTIISMFLWGGVYLMIKQEIIDYRTISLQMIQEDHVE